MRGPLCKIRMFGGMLGLAALALSPASASAQLPIGQADSYQPPPIRHVWVITLENRSFKTVTGAGSPFNSPGLSPYLANVLTKQGNLLTQYWGIGHNSLDNYVAMVSGQSPTPSTQDDCIQTDGGQWTQSDPPVDNHGQVVGQGCTYPAKVKTLADQLDANGLSWKGYMQDLRDTPVGDGGCPTVQNGGSADTYAKKHDPFQWFHSIIDDRSRCLSQDVPLTKLAGDLQSARTTPNFSFISPGGFDDGHDGDWTSNVDPFLRQYVPMIMSSPAYRQDGMIIVTFDESATTVGVPQSPQDDAACCNEIPGPNSPMPGIGGPGGGRTGALVLSPFVKPGTVDDPMAGQPADTSDACTATTCSGPGYYNHYSFLRSMEDLFGIDSGGDDGHGHLGFAGTYADYPGPGSFGPDVYNGWNGQPASPAAPGRPHGPTGPRASDGYAHWQNPVPQGSDLEGVSCPTTETCFAAGDGGTILASSDGGNSFSPQTSGTPAHLRGISCASGTGCVAVGDGGTSLATADGGATWSSAPSGTTVALNGVSCPSASVCVAVGDGGTILRSADGGASWAAQASGTTQPLYGVSCPTASACYAVGRSGTIVATSDGSSWSAKTVAPQSRLWAVSCPNASACVAAGDSGRIWQTINGGATWSGQVNEHAAQFRGASCPSPSSCFLTGEQEQVKPDIAGIYATTNADSTSPPPTWTRQATHSTNLLRAMSCPSTSTCVAVGVGGGILRTTDGGAGWSSRSPGTDGELSRTVCASSKENECLTEGMNALRGASCPNPSTCFAAGNYRTVMATSDGGAHWTTQTSGAPQYTIGAPPVPPPDLNAIGCPSVSSCVAVGDLGSVVTTGDGGATWSNQDSGTNSDLLGVSCPTATVCYAVGSRGRILETQNAGQSWRELSSGTRGLLSAISCPVASTCVAVGSFGTILRTTDGGDHWTAGNSRTSSYLDAVSCPSAEYCIAVGSGGTVLRIAGAGTQAPVRPSGVSDELMAVDCARLTRCVATGSRGTVISTADGGNTWTVQGTATMRALRAATCPATDRCIAAGDAAAILAVTPTAKPGPPPPPPPPPGGGTPSLSIADLSVREGNSGTTKAHLKVSLSSASSQSVSVDYKTSNGTATAPADYTGQRSTTLTFNPGQTSKTILVAVKGDAIDEANQTFRVDLSNPHNATLAGAHGTVTIVDDDGGGGGGGGGGPPPEGHCSHKVMGTRTSDRLTGGAKEDRILGLGGADVIRGLGGGDCLRGGPGADRISGGAGQDRLDGGPGRDALTGGPGNDVVRARGKGNDRVACGPGNDTAIVGRKDRVHHCEHTRRPVRHHGTAKDAAMRGPRGALPRQAV